MKPIQLLSVFALLLSACASTPHPATVPPGAVPTADVDYSSREGWYQRGDNYLLYVNKATRVQEVPVGNIVRVVDLTSDKMKSPYFDFVELRLENGNGHHLVSRTRDAEVISIDLGIRFSRLIAVKALSATRFQIWADFIPTLNNENRTYPEKQVLVRQAFLLDADTSGSGQHTLKVTGGKKL